MNLFGMSHNKPSPTPEALLIPEFMALWARDGKRHKTIAIEDLAYVHFMMNWRSPYHAYPPSERSKKVIEDVILTRPRWKEDDEVKAAMVKYDALQMTPTLRFLRSIENAMEEMIQYFEHVNFDPNKKVTDDHGVERKVPVGNIKAVMEAVAKAAGTLKTIKELTDRVKAEQDAVDNIRGGGSVGDYED